MKKALLITTNLPFGSAFSDLRRYRDGIIKGVEFAINNFEELTIKIHPAESKDYYKFLLQKFSITEIIKNNKDLYTLIKENDVIISFESTALIEAFYFNKECYLIKTFKYDLVYPYNIENLIEIEESIYKLKTCNYFENGESLLNIIEKILTKQVYKD